MPYTLVSYNVGFGAYSADYSFFMDGGTKSRAYSAQAVRDNLSGAMGEVQSLRPDFVFLQEVDQDATRSHHVDETQLVRRRWTAFPAALPRIMIPRTCSGPFWSHTGHPSPVS